MSSIFIFLVITALIGVGLVGLAVWAAAQIFKHDETGLEGAARKEAVATQAKFGVGAIAAAVVGLFLVFSAGGQIMKATQRIIKYQTISEEVIDVLDAHGVDKICQHFDCKNAMQGIQEKVEAELKE